MCINTHQVEYILYGFLCSHRTIIFKFIFCTKRTKKIYILLESQIKTLQYFFYFLNNILDIIPEAIINKLFIQSSLMSTFNFASTFTQLAIRAANDFEW